MMKQRGRPPKIPAMVAPKQVESVQVREPETIMNHLMDLADAAAETVGAIDETQGADYSLNQTNGMIYRDVIGNTTISTLPRTGESADDTLRRHTDLVHLTAHPIANPVYVWNVPGVPGYTLHIAVKDAETVAHARTAAMAHMIPTSDDKDNPAPRPLTAIERRWIETEDPSVERAVADIPLYHDKALRENTRLQLENDAISNTKIVFMSQGIDPENPSDWVDGILSGAKASVASASRERDVNHQLMTSRLLSIQEALTDAIDGLGFAPPLPSVSPVPDHTPLTVVASMTEAEFRAYYHDLPDVTFVERGTDIEPTEQEKAGLRLLFGTSSDGINVPYLVRHRSGAGDTETANFEAALGYLKVLTGQ